jgi:hypothetical protein
MVILFNSLQPFSERSLVTTKVYSLTMNLRLNVPRLNVKRLRSKQQTQNS